MKHPDDEAELLENQIQAAEDRPASHRHGDFDDEAFLAHLRSPHGLDAPDHLSRPALEGLHDRLHQESEAADD